MFWGSGEFGTMGTVLSFTPCRAEIIEARTPAGIQGFIEDQQ